MVVVAGERQNDRQADKQTRKFFFNYWRRNMHMTVHTFAVLFWLSVTDFAGDTALHDAARFGHVGVVRQLIQGKADATTKNKAGQTAADVGASHDKPANVLLGTGSANSAAGSDLTSKLMKLQSLRQQGLLSEQALVQRQVRDTKTLKPKRLRRLQPPYTLPVMWREPKRPFGCGPRMGTRHFGGEHPTCGGRALWFCWRTDPFLTRMAHYATLT